jgi:hypothetical protein
MRLTKHGHACLELLENGKRLIVDPGNYTEDLVGLTDVVAIVLTHNHDDHTVEAQLDRILEASPHAKIFGTDEVVTRLEAAGRYNLTRVHHGDWHEIDGFTLEFFGDLHAEIHRSIPLLQNCGVMINDSLYYPGDSYTRPDRKVKWLACPSSAPWLKISDVIDFINEVKPANSFATHNALLSETGHKLMNGRIKLFTEQHGGKFTYLQVGDSVEL